MLPLEELRGPVEVGLRKLAAGHRDCQLPVLADVAHLDRADELRRLRESLAREVLDRPILHPAEKVVDPREVEETHAHPRRLGVVEPGIGEQGAERRERARIERDQHLADLEAARELARVQWAGAAVGDEREPARVVPAVGRHEAERLRHVRVRDIDDALRDALAGEAERLGERVERAAGRLDVQLQVAGEKELGRETPEHDVRVGRRRLRSATAVAGGARVGAGAARPHLEDPGRVDPGEAAAARPDRARVDHRQRDRHAVLELLEVREGRLGARQQAGLEAGAAHVTGDQVTQADRLAERRRGHDPARRARAHQRDGLLACPLGRLHAAVRAQDEQLVDVALAALPLEAGHVIVQQRLQVRVEHRRRRALVLAPARQHLVRERDEDAWPLLLDQLARAQLVCRVDEREEVGDGDRGDLAGVAQPSDLASHGALVERCQDLAVAQHALRDADATRARHEMARLDPVQVEVVGARHALDAQDVAEAVGREQRHVRSPTLDQRVRRDGGAVHERADLAGQETRFRKRVEHRLRRLAWGGEHLRHPDLPRLLVEEDEIRERPSGVDTGPDRHATSRSDAGARAYCRQSDRSSSSWRSAPASRARFLARPTASPERRTEPSAIRSLRRQVSQPWDAQAVPSVETPRSSGGGSGARDHRSPRPTQAGGGPGHSGDRASRSSPTPASRAPATRASAVDGDHRYSPPSLDHRISPVERRVTALGLLARFRCRSQLARFLDLSLAHARRVDGNLGTQGHGHLTVAAARSWHGDHNAVTAIQQTSRTSSRSIKGSGSAAVPTPR